MVRDHRKRKDRIKDFRAVNSINRKIDLNPTFSRFLAKNIDVVIKINDNNLSTQWR